MIPRAASQNLAMTTQETNERRLVGWTTRFKGRDRVELPDYTSRLDVSVSDGQGLVTPVSGQTSDSEHSKELCKGYSWSLRQGDDVTYVNLGTSYSYPAG